MISEVAYIEDLLEISVGFWTEDKISLNTEDVGIMSSIARQTFKGTALTDRQYTLMQQKLISYKHIFEERGYDFDTIVSTLRKPLREIDRSKYVKIVSTAEVYTDSSYPAERESWQWIAVRFPFAKKLIILIDEIKAKISGDLHYHKRGSHEHYFFCNDRAVGLIIPRFLNKDFEIDQELIDQYNKFKDVELYDFYPHYSDNKLHNVNDTLKEQIKKETDMDHYQIIDRRFRYGIDVPEVDNLSKVGVITDIVKRKNLDYNSNPKEQSFKQIMDALYDLDRFPLLVVLDDKKAEHQLYEFWDYFRYKVPSEQQSVMFRLDNQHYQDFNMFIRDKGLNSPLDKNTKIVYINKINKVVIKSDWTPICAFSYSSTMDRTLNAYMMDNCDLVVFREENTSPFRKYSRLYG